MTRLSEREAVAEVRAAMKGASNHPGRFLGHVASILDRTGPCPVCQNGLIRVTSNMTCEECGRDYGWSDEAQTALEVAYRDAADEVHREARWMLEKGGDPTRLLMIEGILRDRAVSGIARLRHESVRG